MLLFPQPLLPVAEPDNTVTRRNRFCISRNTVSQQPKHLVSDSVSIVMSKDNDATNLSRTFKYLLATQFLSRGIPFIFNTWIVRHLTEEDYASPEHSLSLVIYGKVLLNLLST
ncbi:unnamed protein product [Vicia faba]|uniref:Man(5)GlcNAc(2)-PP-dolichol translocation protein RFT1 n=1 Tax=Vicia faba TaxID=3906 RepID=A0AAV1A0X5_VICFA|nr:unnamed protein product [Vicia faba]